MIHCKECPQNYLWRITLRLHLRSAANASTGLSIQETWRIQRGSPGNPVALHDFHATLLHLVGFDHQKPSKPFQGFNQKPTGVKESKILKDILS
ncbi:MAG: DUF1501 domain-containing protein [Akkermansiaceae bacterium]|nr:DUF1501 domain-containing protein [Akkermansiaceae bacterium]